MHKTTTLYFLLLIGISGCNLFETKVGPTSVSTTYSMSPRVEWKADFSGYPRLFESEMNLVGEHRYLPSPLDTTDRGFYLAGTNLHNHLFMFTRHRMANLQEGSSYRVTFRVTIATNVSSCPDSTETLGARVYVKAGVTNRKPHSLPQTISDTVYYHMNIDKGDTAQGGNDAVVLGNIINSQSCTEGNEYRLKTLSGHRSLEVDTNNDGSVWVFTGFDTAQEGRIRLYITRFNIQAVRI